MSPYANYITHHDAFELVEVGLNWGRDEKNELSLTLGFKEWVFGIGIRANFHEDDLLRYFKISFLCITLTIATWNTEKFEEFEKNEV